MTRLLITPRYGFATTGFSFTTCTWREAKGSCFMMEQKQQAAGDPLILRQGSRDQAAGWGMLKNPVHVLNLGPSAYYLSGSLIRCGTQAEKFHFRHLATAEKQCRKLQMYHKEHTSCSFICFFIFFLGCLSTAIFYFMPSVSATVFCCGLLTWVVMNCSPECRLQ